MERKSTEEEYVFRAREMPKFPTPPSPQKSTISNVIAFKGKNNIKESFICRVSSSHRSEMLVIQ